MKRIALITVLSVATLSGAPGCADGSGGHAVFGGGAPTPVAGSVLTAEKVTVTSADRFAVPLDRMRSEYLGLGSGLAPTAIATLNAHGGWSDIDYDDRSIGTWKPMLHLERVRAMVVAYSAPEGRFSKSATVHDDIVRALRAWVARNPQSNNWWHNTIGVQLALMPVLVLMDAELPDDLRRELLASFVSFSSVRADRKTGQNLVWYATQQIVKGALTRNSADIATGRDAIRSTLVITTDEGLQADLSFHQHGNQLYSGGYGLAYLSDVARLATWLQGTEWQLTNADLNLLADFATAGVGPLVWGHWLDWSARGREITRHEPQPRPMLLRDAVNRLLALAPDRGTALVALSERLRNGASPQLASTHGYWRSDFLAHQTTKGYFSVKMASGRTTGTESGNGENLLGYWLPFGTTFIVGAGNGNEYLGLQPLLDWSALPGTTAPGKVPRFSGYLRHAENRVAVLSDTVSGIASMQVNTQGLQAKKFWFLDGDVMVALGADIRYSGPESVRTTLNQTRWAGTHLSSAAPHGAGTDFSSAGNITWMTHGGVGYVLLDNQGLVLSVEERKLRDRDPTTFVNGADPDVANAEKVLTLSVNHGVRPQDASYAYAVAHGIDRPGQLQALALPKVLANTGRVQGVRSFDGSRFALVFHQPGQVDLGQGVFLRADQAVAVLGVLKETVLQLQVIDLVGVGGAVTLRTIKEGQTLDRQTQVVPGNAQRTLEESAATMSLAVSP